MKPSKLAKLARVPGVADARIVSTYQQLTVQKFHDMLINGELHPDPVSQRGATIGKIDNLKNKRIIQCIMDGTGVGLMIVRDIENCTEEEVKRLYPNYKSLMIDGGHRGRSVKHYISNRFAVLVNGVDGVEKKFKDLTDDERYKFLNTQLMLEYKICTSLQAIEIFRSVNSTTAVNAYEMIMANDQSAVCKYVRMFSRSYVEYQNNTIHPIFHFVHDTSYNPKADHFANVNERAIWDTFVFIVLHKAIGRGNVDAGHEQSNVLIQRVNEGKFTIKSEVKNTVNRFFNDLHAFQQKHKTKISTESFGAFQCVWFELYRQHKIFKIDMDVFVPVYSESLALFIGKKNRKYQNKTIVNLDGETVGIKQLVRQDVKTFSNGERQSFAAKIILEEVGNIEDAGITVLESQRSYRRKDRQEVLDLQKGRCHMCKKPVTIDECELAHDTPYSRGGKVKDGVAMCRKCHSGQGMLTLNEFEGVVSARKSKKLG